MQVTMLGNRVAKNARHLGKWARREAVTCYRLYDRDIPEIPITIDTYEGALVVNDYRAADRAGGQDWLDAMATAARDALGATEVFVKQRERLAGRREGHQYEKQDASAWRTVHEGGHRFRVDLAGYIDTGLFLDHRNTRARVAAEPARTMLNLFAYTGSFSVYAAAAGMATTSVDLSRTYLDWAGENLRENDLTGELVQSDVRTFLREARHAGRRWDLAVVDPPTFSNSKRMAYTWDVQRDHAALLDDVAALAGVIWFSTNRRRFRLEWSAPNAEIVDETRATVPPDFRDRRVHQAWRIELRR
jgi:23S rRNA (guanine2445-N2)-methyltransferase / 23S rRNA (guanine2069-N7)-methyltransferase